jgi:flagellar biosynthesis chaperone FliJ
VRSLLLLGLVVVAAASTMEAGTPFGAAVLAQLESKISAGSPIDELKGILQDISDRIEAASTADIAASNEDQRYCTAREEKLATDISLEEGAISSLQNQIKRDDEVIAEKTAEIEKLKKELEVLREQIAENKRLQAEAVAERARQHAEWIQSTNDANICISAVESIQALGGIGKLIENQRDSKANYQEGVRSFLQELSGKVQTERVTNLVELTSLAAATIDPGDVDHMNQLLTQLKTELEQYITDIKNDEAHLKTEHDKYISDMKADETALMLEKADKSNRSLEASQVKMAAEDRNTHNWAELTEAQSSKNALEVELKDFKIGCNERYAAHQEREADRTKERNTLNQIKDFLLNKLDKHFQEGGHVGERIQSVA